MTDPALDDSPVVIGPDHTWERRMAVDQAVFLHQNRYDNAGSTVQVDRELRRTAAAIYDFLAGPAHLYLSIGPVTDQATGQYVSTPKGSPVQITETQQFTVDVDVRSAKGTAIPDDPNTATDDVLFEIGDPGVASVLLDPSGRRATVVAGVAGSTDLTVSLGELSARVAVDVVPGGAATLNVTTGDPTEQGAGEPV